MEGGNPPEAIKLDQPKLLPFSYAFSNKQNKISYYNHHQILQEEVFVLEYSWKDSYRLAQKTRQRYLKRLYSLIERRKNKIFSEKEVDFYQCYEKFRLKTFELLNIYKRFLRQNAFYEEKTELENVNFKILEKNLEILFEECKNSISLVK